MLEYFAGIDCCARFIPPICLECESLPTAVVLSERCCFNPAFTDEQSIFFSRDFPFCFVNKNLLVDRCKLLDMSLSNQEF